MSLGKANNQLRKIDTDLQELGKLLSEIDLGTSVKTENEIRAMSENPIRLTREILYSGEFQKEDLETIIRYYATRLQKLNRFSVSSTDSNANAKVDVLVEIQEEHDELITLRRVLAEYATRFAPEEILSILEEKKNNLEEELLDIWSCYFELERMKRENPKSIEQYRKNLAIANEIFEKYKDDDKSPHGKIKTLKQEKKRLEDKLTMPTDLARQILRIREALEGEQQEEEDSKQELEMVHLQDMQEQQEEEQQDKEEENGEAIERKAELAYWESMIPDEDKATMEELYENRKLLIEVQRDNRKLGKALILLTWARDKIVQNLLNSDASESVKRQMKDLIERRESLLEVLLDNDAIEELNTMIEEEMKTFAEVQADIDMLTLALKNNRNAKRESDDNSEREEEEEEEPIDKLELLKIRALPQSEIRRRTYEWLKELTGNEHKTFSLRDWVESFTPIAMEEWVKSQIRKEMPEEDIEKIRAQKLKEALKRVKELREAYIRKVIEEIYDGRNKIETERISEDIINKAHNSIVDFGEEKE